MHARHRRHGERVRCPTISTIATLLILVSTTGSGQDFRDRDVPGTPGNSQRAPVDLRYLPPGTRPPAAYKLGINANQTQTGVQVTHVLPGSVAQRAGLEAGDTIVTVNGYQVGYVAGRLYDLGDELARRVDRQGRVTLLVRNDRDGRLVNVPAEFRQAVRVISGNVNLPDRNVVARQGVLTVRLLDVTQPHWRDVTVAEVSFNIPPRWPSIYRLEVDPSSLRDGHRYAVDARVTDRGQVMYSTPDNRRVTISENGARADLTLARSVNRPGGGAVPYEQILHWYLRYLGRRPSTRELSVWQSDLDRGKSLEDVQAGILSSSEFFDRQQNDRDRYVDEVYRHLNGATPTPAEHQNLREQLKRQGDVRQRFTRDLLQRSRDPNASPRE